MNASEQLANMAEDMNTLLNGFYPEMATAENVQSIYTLINRAINLKDMLVEYMVAQDR